MGKRYHRAKLEEIKSEILTEINDIQTKLNNFDKDMQKKKTTLG